MAFSNSLFLIIATFTFAAFVDSYLVSEPVPGIEFRDQDEHTPGRTLHFVRLKNVTMYFRVEWEFNNYHMGDLHVWNLTEVMGSSDCSMVLQKLGGEVDHWTYAAVYKCDSTSMDPNTLLLMLFNVLMTIILVLLLIFMGVRACGFCKSKGKPSPPSHSVKEVLQKTAERVKEVSQKKVEQVKEVPRKV